MNRFFTVFLCLTLTLSLSCFAVVDPDAYWYPINETEYGYDHDGYNHDVAVEMIREAGIDLNADDYFVYDGENYRFDNDAFMRDYNALVTVEPEPDVTVPIEEEETPEPYPVEWPEKEVLEDEIISDVSLDETVLENTEIDPVLELGIDTLTPMVYSVNDLRSGGSDSDSSDLIGLKAVIRSIFGEYTPNMTTTAVTETVDGEVITSLIDTVANGTAGVDWEYISGVFIFGIMLYCLFKLLGGIIT